MVQVYKNKLNDKYKGLLEEISRRLPVAVKVIDGVGENIEIVTKKVILELFDWIDRHATLSNRLVRKLERYVQVVRIFHYGEPYYSHQRYLNEALRYAATRVRIFT